MTELHSTGRYLLFRGAHYYAAGGWLDYAGSYGTLDDAKAQPARQDTSGSWRHVVDSGTGRIVFAKPDLDSQGRDDQEYQLDL